MSEHGQGTVPSREQVEAFAASGYGGLRDAYPGLTHRWTPEGVEWSLVASRPVAGEVLPCRASLRVESVCYEESSDILDAMAAAGDAILGREALEEVLRDEAAFLEGRLTLAIETMHRRSERDLDGGFLDPAAYAFHVDGFLRGRTISLYPPGSDEPGSRYKVSTHLKDVAKQACYVGQRGAFQERRAASEAARAARQSRPVRPASQRAGAEGPPRPRRGTGTRG